ncbi:hypothetical protein TPB0596_10120 [Tsukamurella pulmonis]|uniref:hypothetical protein n=1 Tax=Tsukamurella pulmonis TaxID=47312 RepID=UPI001EDE08BC|nr:hypothetical protein [Tsukamurella pulmonis]BDD81249.1 hypothetical protein TPB0596_10120 [Tsukamurella pulmonis]
MSATQFTYRVEWSETAGAWVAICDQLHGLSVSGETYVEALQSIVAKSEEIARRGQQWFWTKEWQEGEREVDEAVARGEIETFDSGEEFLHHLDHLEQVAGKGRRTQEEYAQMSADAEAGLFVPVPGSAMISVQYLQENPDALVRMLRQVAPERLRTEDSGGTDTDIHRTVPTDATVDWVKSDSFVTGTSTVYLVALPVHLNPGYEVQVQSDLGYFLDPHQAAAEARKRLEFQVEHAPVEHRHNFAVSGAAVIPVSSNDYPAGLPLKPWSVRLARKGTDSE